MKRTAAVFILLFCGSSFLWSQPDHPIKEESFQVKMRIEKNGRFEVLSFVAPQANATRAKITSPGDLSGLELAPGTVLEGEFIFGLFSGPSGTGKTLRYQGQGTGTLTLNEDSMHISGKKSPLKNIQIRLRR